MSRIGVIDGLRGAAVLAVIHHHVFGTTFAPGWHSVQLGPFHLFPFTLLSNGWAGLIAVFLLSGLAVTLSTLPHPQALDRPGGWRAFYEQQCLQRLPLYMIALGVAYLAAALGLINASLLTHPASVWLLTLLGLEAITVAAFPLLMLAQDRLGWPNVLALSALWIVVGERLLGGLSAPALPLSACLAAFVTGMWLAMIYHKRSWFARGPQLRLGILCVLCSLMAIDAIALDVLSLRLRAWSLMIVLLGLTLLCAFVLSNAYHPLRRLVESRWLVSIGRAGSSLLVWHLLLVDWLTPTRGVEYLLLYTGVLTLVATLSRAYLESTQLWAKVLGWKEAPLKQAPMVQVS